jgi:hypothetical protein
MTATIEPARSGHGWQLILADLALILFLVTLSALPAAEAETGQRLADSDARSEDAARALEVAPAQALYRPIAGGPSLGAWLAAQPRDPRATLTVFAQYRPSEAQRAWEAAAALAADAQARGVAVRTIIAAGDSDDIYASLAYDTVIARGSK